MNNCIDLNIIWVKFCNYNVIILEYIYVCVYYKCMYIYLCECIYLFLRIISLYRYLGSS